MKNNNGVVTDAVTSNINNAIDGAVQFLESLAPGK
jgi:hypothetical protein